MARQSTMHAFLVASTPRQNIARSASSESTLSCISVNNETRLASMDADDSAAAMSSTPPTSLDTASQSSELKRDEQTTTSPASGGRSRRARTSVVTYNENTLSRSTRQAPPASGSSRRDLSAKTLVQSGEEAAEQDDLVSDSIQLLDLDWRVDALPGEKLDLDNGKLPAPKVGRRASLLKKATSAIDKSKSVLGKRTRDLIDAGKNMGRRSSLRTREPVKESPAVETPEPEAQPLAKKRRVADLLAPTAEIPQASEMKSTPSTRLNRKIYLKQGLYVGQEQDFDARFNPAQKLKRKQKDDDKPEQPAKKRTILPLPMFGGKRVIDAGRDFKMPFDVFNPLPSGQPKPDEWRKTQRNVFVGDAADYWRISKNLEHSTCQCTSETGCDEDCFNRFMFYECDKNNCNLRPENCTNRSFAQLKERHKHGNKYNVGVEVMKTESKGYGVRSCRTFAPGQIIVEYTGEIITQDECDSRMRTIYKNNECFYLMMFDQNMIIDATRGSIARFVNHSCEPNCRMVKWTVDGKPRMALFAGDNGIMTAEELTYDYNFDPFSAKNIQECHCGMPSCRGVLGPKPKDREPKEAVKSIVKETGGTKRKIKEVVEKGVEQMKNKKRRLSADMSTMLKNNKEDRAARAALRANIKGAKSKRVAAKLTEKKASKQPAKKVSSRSLVSAKSGPSGKVLVTVTKKTGTARTKANAASMRSNVVKTMKGANGKGKKTIKVVEKDIFDVPADDDDA